MRSGGLIRSTLACSVRITCDIVSSCDVSVYILPAGLLNLSNVRARVKFVLIRCGWILHNSTIKCRQNRCAYVSTFALGTEVVSSQRTILLVIKNYIKILNTELLILCTCLHLFVIHFVK